MAATVLLDPDLLEKVFYQMKGSRREYSFN